MTTEIRKTERFSNHVLFASGRIHLELNVVTEVVNGGKPETHFEVLKQKRYKKRTRFSTYKAAVKMYDEQLSIYFPYFC